MADVKLADYAQAADDIGLGSVDNTADADKPVSAAQATAIAAAKVQAIAACDPAGSAAAAQSAAALDATTKANAAQAASTPIAHAGNTSNPHGVTKAQVGLGNADNTSDANKPISTATQTALNGKVGSTDVTLIVKLTQAAYDALSPKVATTLYVVVG